MSLLLNIKYLVWKPNVCKECGSQDLSLIIQQEYRGRECNDCGYEESDKLKDCSHCDDTNCEICL